jgi:glycosyltransferase involved in cell wall biosynthesis
MAQIKRRKLIIIADAFLSSNSSAAIQIKDLAESLSKKYAILIIRPSFTIKSSFYSSSLNNIEILELKTLNIKNKNFILRALAEILMPFFMCFHYKKFFFYNEKITGIIWYSPSIFFGPFIFLLKKKFNCKTYLILRDIFPQWAVDLNILKKGFAYFLFKFFEKLQYEVADRIGVQTTSNINYFLNNEKKFINKIEVLNNWLSDKKSSFFSSDLIPKEFKKKFIFVYAGNLGVAQNLYTFLDLANSHAFKINAVILFVGNGSESPNLMKYAVTNKIDNVFFVDEVPSKEISSLISKCDVGIISLDVMHKIDNIPGKFLQYLQCGKPVLSKVNPNNDLIKIVRQNNLGQCIDSNNLSDFVISANLILRNLRKDKYFYTNRCKDYYNKNFKTSKISNQLDKFFLGNY